MTPQPLNSAPAQGPVEGRGVAEIRADLATCEQLAIVPWPAAARRLLADVPQLLAEVEAAHRFERSVAVEREALLAEVERLREDLAYAVADAKRWHDGWQELGRIYAADVDALRVERDSLRGVVQAVEKVLAYCDETIREALPTGGDCEEHIDAYRVRRLLRAALAAAADAPQPEPDDEHFPWHYTEFGVVCACGEPMRNEVCPAGPSPAVLPEKEQSDV